MAGDKDEGEALARLQRRGCSGAPLRPLRGKPLELVRRAELSSQ